jgi:transglutaminase-like putative cysteine protease
MTDRCSLQHLLLIVLCSFGILMCTVRAAEPTSPPVSFSVAPAPAWVQSVEPDNAPPTEPASDGISYVLVDQQENLEPRASYYHEARRITSENGVQNGAGIAVSFDPSYQKLTFHSIRLVRQGVAADRLDRSLIKLLQREQEMESFLYDGSYTAQYQLEDVRVGDLIEYAYTIEGANPVMKGKYFDTFATDWVTPVRHAITRIVYPAQRKLNFLIKSRPISPVTATNQGTTEWRWDETNIPARRVDPNTPRGYNPYGTVQISEFADWQQLVEWAVPLYQTAASLSPDLANEIEKLRAIENPEERILTALRFVQDEIRYLGIESGVGSHQPTAPSEVLRRRFGDCKDKTLLLGTLLRNTGLTATPALVSSRYRGGVAQRLPSPAAFNHVILQVETGNATHWLDATRSYQRGPLSQIYVGDFGYALVLRSGVKELTAYAPPPDSLPKKKIVEKYRINSPGRDTVLEVISEFRGVSAESIRTYFQTNNKEDIQKHYLRYYAQRFPQIYSTKPVDYQELPGGVGCAVTEYYVIPGIWQITDDKTQYKVTLHPNDVDQEMGTPGAVRRNDPLAVNHPVDMTQEIHAEMFEDWPLKPSHRDVSNAFFRFRHDSKGTGSKLQMHYSYTSLVDQVSVTDLPSYDTTLRTLKDSLGYTLTYSTPEQLTARRQKDPNSGYGQFNWPIAILLGAIIAAAIPLTARYYHASKLVESLPPSLTHRSLEGIGGWLLLVAFGLLFRPLSFLHANIEIGPSVFDLERWRNLTHVGQPAYHPYWMPTLLFELIYNSLAFIYCSLLVILFFKKRAVWPRCYILFFVFILIGLTVDHGLGLQIPAAAATIGDSTKALGQTVVASFIWIPYCLTSKRVKATFRH